MLFHRVIPFYLDFGVSYFRHYTATRDVTVNVFGNSHYVPKNFHLIVETGEDDPIVIVNSSLALAERAALRMLGTY